MCSSGRHRRCFQPEKETTGSHLITNIVHHPGNEKLPTELGWTPQADPVTLEDTLTQVNAIAAAANLFTSTSNGTASSAHRRRVLARDLHSAFLA